jgi:hypothetical protein
MRPLLVLLFACVGCHSNSPAPKPQVDVPVSRFGAPLSAPSSAPTPIAEVLARPDAFAGKPLIVDGKVRAACTRKGCWMELASSTEKGPPGCRVTFKNYGFFVPTDSAGANARVEGVAEVSTIPAAEVAHLESEGGSFRKEADGSAKEVRIVATGVELRRAATSVKM